MPVPSARKPAVTLDPMKLKVVLYAAPGFGKSTFLSHMPDDMLILALDPGWDSLAGRMWQDADGNYVIRDWDTLAAATKEAMADPSVKAVALDHVDLLVEYLSDVVVKEAKAESITDMDKLPYGDGFTRVSVRLRRWINYVLACGKGLYLVAHPIEFEESVEGKKNKVKTGLIVPRIPDTPRKKINPYSVCMTTCDVVMFGREAVVVKKDAQAEGKETRSVVRAWFTGWDCSSPKYDAKERTGLLPLSFECDKETCGAGAFLAAFANQPRPKEVVTK